MMKLDRTKSPLASLFFALSLISGYFLIVNQANALTCAWPPKIFVASYQQGLFIDGFAIEHKSTGAGGCGNRPVVNMDATSVQSIFATAIQSLQQSPDSGVYELTTRCSVGWWNERCAPDTKMERLSTDPNSLLSYRQNWELQEQAEEQRMSTQKVVATVIGIIVLALVALWPFVLAKMWSGFRNHLPWLIILAIALQIHLAWFILQNGSDPWSGAPRGVARVVFSGLCLWIIPELVILVVSIVRGIKASRRQ